METDPSDRSTGAGGIANNWADFRDTITGPRAVSGSWESMLRDSPFLSSTARRDALSDNIGVLNREAE